MSANGYAGDGNKVSADQKYHLMLPQHTKTTRYTVKLQPSIYWATIGLEFEYVVSTKVSIAALGGWKYAGMDYAVKDSHAEQDYMSNGYLAELMGRYYIKIHQRHLSMAPLGFYVQGCINYSRLLYYDGSIRPFSLHTRGRASDAEGSLEKNFAFPNPIGGSISAGYQVELLPNVIIANFNLGTQMNSDNKGLFLTFFASPSIGMMF